jgi:hypothetical protein
MTLVPVLPVRADARERLEEALFEVRGVIGGQKVTVPEVDLRRTGAA